MKAKKILIGLLIALAIFCTVWLGGRYGWRLLGFSACGGSGIESVEVTADQVRIQGFYPGSFPAGCVGYVTRTKDDTLYVGVRYDPVFGVFETGQFQAEIPVDREIRRVVLKTGDSEYEIWKQ